MNHYKIIANNLTGAVERMNLLDSLYKNIIRDDINDNLSNSDKEAIVASIEHIKTICLKSVALVNKKPFWRQRIEHDIAYFEGMEDMTAALIAHSLRIKKNITDVREHLEHEITDKPKSESERWVRKVRIYDIFTDAGRFLFDLSMDKNKSQDVLALAVPQLFPSIDKIQSETQTRNVYDQDEPYSRHLLDHYTPNIEFYHNHVSSIEKSKQKRETRSKIMKDDISKKENSKYKSPPSVLSSDSDSEDDEDDELEFDDLDLDHDTSDSDGSYLNSDDDSDDSDYTKQ